MRNRDKLKLYTLLTSYLFLLLFDLCLVCLFHFSHLLFKSLILFIDFPYGFSFFLLLLRHIFSYLHKLVLKSFSGLLRYLKFVTSLFDTLL